ncbi:MAG: coniferyl aldehyde dehydrogenase [Gemmatimonadaceae bacterium]
MIDQIFDAQQQAFRANPNPSASERKKHLGSVVELLRENADGIARAINDDFGHRSTHETTLLEIFPTIEDARHARKNVARWMRTDRVSTALWFRPARSRIIKQPIGVVGIVAPWNYPINLSVGPLIAALAAGNRAMIKMSELTPNTGALLAKLFGERFNRDLVSFINGGVGVAKEMCSKPFDHLLFTGSTTVGKSVMQAASGNLTPVTLELGGKSPAVVAPGYPIDRAAQRIMLGKCLNAGQTCIATDYVLLPRDQVDAFRTAAIAAVKTFYPDGTSSGDYTSIVSDHHMTRLTEWLREATASGARVDRVGLDDVNARKFAPTLLSDVAANTRVMQEEIFGPILPIVPYDSLDGALQYIADRPRPLAMYYFDDNGGRTNHVLETSIAGGVSVNDTMFHFAQDSLPFGGIGASGMGSYHGVHGFNTFTKMKGVFYQSRVNGGSLLFPPFGTRIERLLKLIIG